MIFLRIVDYILQTVDSKSDLQHFYIQKPRRLAGFIESIRLMGAGLNRPLGYPR